ncbi:Hypothetical predicted protein [Olea europaea subsp. europaea]|uniref:Uncharacterized protein n=1 Tax=Olea europaea subsp. europaea TaxID=158383 RepID=A0A8S0RF92_OLEEU|nr:Hypothetical predicted protein [Olea europaea subsp. europaea]
MYTGIPMVEGEVETVVMIEKSEAPDAKTETEVELEIANFEVARARASAGEQVHVLDGGMKIVGTQSLEAIYDEYPEDKRPVAEYNLLMQTQVVQEKDVKLATIEKERDLSMVKVSQLEENKIDFMNEIKMKEKDIRDLETKVWKSTSQNERVNGRSNWCKVAGYRKVSWSFIKRNQEDEMNGAYVILH